LCFAHARLHACGSTGNCSWFLWASPWLSPA
jgi:hypothetical protein